MHCLTVTWDETDNSNLQRITEILQSITPGKPKPKTSFKGKGKKKAKPKEEKESNEGIVKIEADLDIEETKDECPSMMSHKNFVIPQVIGDLRSTIFDDQSVLYPEGKE